MVNPQTDERSRIFSYYLVILLLLYQHQTHTGTSRMRKILSPCSHAAAGYLYPVHFVQTMEREKDYKTGARKISFPDSSATLSSCSYRIQFVSIARKKEDLQFIQRDLKDFEEKCQDDRSYVRGGFRLRKLLSWKLSVLCQNLPEVTSPYSDMSSLKRAYQYLKNVNVIVLVKHSDRLQ